MGENITNSTNSEIYLFRTLNDHKVTLFIFIVSLVRMLLSVMIVVLNGIVISVMVKHYLYENIADRLVIGLSIVSVTAGLFYLVSVIQNIVYYQSAEECLIRNGLTSGLMLCSSFHLLCLTTHRFFKISSPFGVKVSGEKKKAIRILLVPCIWVFSLISGMLPFFGWNTKDRHLKEEKDRPCSYFGLFARSFLWSASNTYACRISDKSVQQQNSKMWNRFILVLMESSFVISLVLYVAIYCSARKHMVTAADMANKHSLYRASIRYAKTVFLILGLYFLFWTPFVVLHTLHLSGDLENLSTQEKDQYMVYTDPPVYLTFISNPIIYAIGVKQVRRRFIDMLPNCCKRSFLLQQFVPPSDSDTERDKKNKNEDSFYDGFGSSGFSTDATDSPDQTGYIWQNPFNLIFTYLMDALSPESEGEEFPPGQSQSLPETSVDFEGRKSVDIMNQTFADTSVDLEGQESFDLQSQDFPEESVDLESTSSVADHWFPGAEN